ncbi:hypothetical protein [Catenulispora subtropica]|uniref:Transcriptional regulator n=1 Tax=Catenulispora subtropica TaxID=450798 RepID=A0ABN2TEU0_9ACTN
MATLDERKAFRTTVLKTLYEAVATNRPVVSGASLRDRLSVPEEDLSAACTYLAGEGLIAVDWTSHATPAAISLTHEGIRFMEEIEAREE